VRLQPVPARRADLEEGSEDADADAHGEGEELEVDRDGELGDHQGDGRGAHDGPDQDAGRARK
jgi:hypothetical protein